MVSMTDITTFDFRPALLARNKVGEICISPQAEEEILKLVHVKRDFDTFYDTVMREIAEEMRLKGLNNVKAERITVSRKLSGGAKFSLVDKEAALSMGLAKPLVINQVRVDSKAVEAYYQQNGELPECVEPIMKEEKVEIKEV